MQLKVQKYRELEAALRPFAQHLVTRLIADHGGDLGTFDEMAQHDSGAGSTELDRVMCLFTNEIVNRMVELLVEVGHRPSKFFEVEADHGR